MRNPASDVAELLNGKDAGGSRSRLATNLFKGFVRRADATTSPAVFVANTGGPPPEPYVSGARQSTVRATVQVMVRGAVNEFQAGETVARASGAGCTSKTCPTTSPATPAMRSRSSSAKTTSATTCGASTSSSST